MLIKSVGIMVNSWAIAIVLIVMTIIVLLVRDKMRIGYT